jgi:putative transposase
VIDALEQARLRHRFHVWAYVLMPEHIHLLLWPTNAEYSISKILLSIKAPVSKRALHYVRKNAPAFMKRMEDLQPNGKRHYRLWQRGGGYDRNVTEPSTVWSTVDYIHNNPVRRGLCDRAIQWKWSSALELGARGCRAFASGPRVISQNGTRVMRSSAMRAVVVINRGPSLSMAMAPS